MSARRFKKSWWADFYFEGMRYRRRSPVNSCEGTKEYESSLRQRLLRGDSIDRRENGGDTTYKKFSKEFYDIYVKNNNKHSETITKESVLRVHLVPFFGKMKLGRIDNLKTEEYKREKIRSGLSKKSINNHLTILKKSLDTAIEWGYIQNCPKIKLLKVEQRSRDYLSENECAALLDGATGVIREMIFLALKTGLRFGEIIALGWRDVDMTNKLLTVSKSISKGLMGSTKSNRIRHIPLSRELYEMLNRKSRKSEFIFANSDGSPMIQRACSYALYKACRQSNLKMIGWHALRHTFASHLAQRGVSLSAIQKLLGHSDIRTTMIYAHLSPSELRSAIDCLDSESLGQPVGNFHSFDLRVPEPVTIAKSDL